MRTIPVWSWLRMFYCIMCIQPTLLAKACQYRHGDATNCLNVTKTLYMEHSTCYIEGNYNQYVCKHGMYNYLDVPSTILMPHSSLQQHIPMLTCTEKVERLLAMHVLGLSTHEYYRTTKQCKWPFYLGTYACVYTDDVQWIIYKLTMLYVFKAMRE